MNREKIGGQLLYAIDEGSDPCAKFRVRINRKIGKLFAATCLGGIGVDQTISAEISVVADIIIEQIVLLSTDESVTSISLIAERDAGPIIPATGC